MKDKLKQNSLICNMSSHCPKPNIPYLIDLIVPHSIIQTDNSTLFSLAFCSVSSNFSTTDNLLTGSAAAEDCVVLSTTDQQKYYWQIFQRFNHGYMVASYQMK